MENPALVLDCGRWITKEKLAELTAYRRKYWATPVNRARANEGRRTRYAVDRSPRLIKNRENRERLKQFVWAEKDKPCTVCGGKFHPCAMHFDHRDPATKIFTVSKGYQACNSMKKIQEEIAKCDLVCANCHAVRTYEQNRTGYFLKGWHPNVIEA